MITDPTFYALAVIAVFVMGVWKGGFGGGLGIIAVPLMSLAISPVQAAAILLPILCFMDLISVRAFWRRWSVPELGVLIPASVVGVVAGTLAFDRLDENAVKLLIGLVALAFTVYHYAGIVVGRSGRRWPRAAGRVAGAVGGFTSFVAHAGGPPVDMYLLRRSLDKTSFVGTTVLFFLVVNYVKLVPYAWLGQFDGANLTTSALLLPVAAAGVLTGVWLHHRASERLFFGVVYVALTFVAVKLIADGLGL